MATAVAANSFAFATEIDGEDAKPHAPLTITRTPSPTTESSLCDSGFASRSCSNPVRVFSIRTSTCDAPSDCAVSIAASDVASNGSARKSASTLECLLIRKS